MSNDSVSRYFSENASAWIADAYARQGHAYPVGLARNRIVLEILSEAFGTASARLLDIGCGGGHLCLAAATAGHQALGVDASAEMIQQATAHRSSAPAAVSERLEFRRLSLAESDGALPDASFDAVTAMGFIGYLPHDDELFTRARRLLKPGGRLIVSCRNRLFNMTSGSKYLRREVEAGSAAGLLAELEEYYQPVHAMAVAEFAQRLESAVSRHKATEPALAPGETTETAVAAPQFTSSVEARQHTPRELAAAAEGHGLSVKRLVGVHPHLFNSRFNQLLPPQVFNELSDALCAFERFPVSLTWSSVFIAELTV